MLQYALTVYVYLAVITGEIPLFLPFVLRLCRTPLTKVVLGLVSLPPGLVCRLVHWHCDWAVDNNKSCASHNYHILSMYFFAQLLRLAFHPGVILNFD